MPYLMQLAGVPSRYHQSSPGLLSICLTAMGLYPIVTAIDIPLWGRLGATTVRSP